MIPDMGLLFWSRAVALNVCIITPPIVRVDTFGDMMSVDRNGAWGFTVTVVLSFRLEFDAFTNEVPDAIAVKVAEAFPSDPVSE